MGYIGVGSITEDEAVKDHTKSCCYLVQEFMDGGTLKQKVWRQVSHCSRKYFPLISTIFFFFSVHKFGWFRIALLPQVIWWSFLDYH